MGGNTLHKIGEHRPDARADLIFIHGLDGDARHTWMSDPKDETSFWPGWLAAERPAINIWSLDYPSASNAWFGKGMDILSAANSLLDRLPQSGIGERPIIFVVHSLGGLIAKQMLRTANEANDKEWTQIVKNTRGIAFLATPHSGAALANFIVTLGEVLGVFGWFFRRQKTIDNLEANNPQLAALNDWYRDHSSRLGVATKVYREDVAVGGIMIVNETSANPGLADVRPIPIARDHITICKPANKDDQVYIGVRKFVDDCLTGRATPAPDAAPQPLFSTPPPASPVPYALPPAGRFFGREAEKAAMIAAALDDDPRPIIVLGQAGIGKSALTLQMLHDEAVDARFGERRYFIRLDTATEARAIWTAILVAWGETPGPNPAAQVITALRGAPALLTLDNGETSWQADTEGSEAVFAELAAVEGLKLVVSIRGQKAPFGLDWRRPVEALEPLPPDQAKALFISIAGPAIADDPSLPELLKALDGLPLAITLLAYQAQGETQLKSILSDYRARRLTLTVGKGKNLDLATSIQLSLDSSKLDDAARKMFLLAGRLPAGIADEDAAQLVDDGVAAARALRQIGLAFGARERTLMLAPIREYAAICAIGGEDQAKALAHYLGLLTTEGPKIGGEGGLEALTRLAPEMGNFEAIVTLIAQSAGNDEVVGKQRAHLVVDAAYGLCELMRLSGLGSLTNYETTVTAARKLGDTFYEADCIFRLGLIAHVRSVHDVANAAFNSARLLFKNADNILGEANCIISLGESAFERDDYQTAYDAYQEARPLFQRCGDTLGEASCICNLANVAYKRGEYDTARKGYEEARPLFQHAGEMVGEANCIFGLGNVAMNIADRGTASELIEQARQIYMRVGAILGEANCSRSFGDIAYRAGDHSEARRSWVDSLALFQKVTEPRSIGEIIRRLARVSEGAERAAHVAAARAAFASIDRPDLIAELDAEFGAT